jgi:uncharacterized protein
MSPARSLSLDVDRLPASGESRHFRLPLAQLPRFASGLVSDAGGVDATIGFDRLEGLPVLEVRATADAQLVCQRCLQPVTLRVEGCSRVALVESMEQADRLPEDVEPVWVEGRSVDLAALVEEELLLALPLVPMHEHGDPHCGVAAVDRHEPGPAPPDVDGEAAAVVQKPFAELGELLRRRK